MVSTDPGKKALHQQAFPTFVGAFPADGLIVHTAKGAPSE